MVAVRALLALCVSVLCCAVTVRAQNVAQLMEECPGLQNGICTTECQVHICTALAAFYNATLNVTDPWDNEDGWQLTATRRCEDLVDSSPRKAVYCSWFGITCCDAAAIAAGNCTTRDTIESIVMPINNLNASVNNPAVVQPLLRIHACGLKALNLEASNLVGRMSDLWGKMVNLRVLNLGNCWIDGSIPASLRRLRKLRFINLSNNWLNGTLPSWIDELQDLQVLNLGSQFGENEGSDSVGLMGTVPKQIGFLKQLRELNLETNALTGTLPPNLCSGADSRLLLLNLRANQLTGDATAVESCHNLVQLDISNNYFSGSLPAGPAWSELTTYRACCNEFTGVMPLILTTNARILELLDISNNQLSGMFPNHVTLLSALKLLDISGNRFTGTLTEDVYYLPALTSIALSNNQFVGTIPPAIGLAYSLQNADFSNNPGLTGYIPPELGLVESLRTIRLQNTSLSCSGIIKPYIITTNASCSDPERCKTPRVFGKSSTRYHICSAEEQLPCFLQFSDYLVPRDDASNIRCKVILRMPQQEAIQSCSGQDSTQLAEQAGLLPNISSEQYDQTWYLDPAYYQYQACECLLGYDQVWDNSHTVLRCVPADHSGFATYQRTAIIVSSIAAAAILVAVGIVWRQYISTRPQWLRERIMQQKRIKGAPKCGKPGDKVAISIVVTDVKDFSELTRRCPELMNKAMGGHNNILRKACQVHAGYVLDQEGDSWTVAFHDAEDAVGFSLQVQQALAHKVWAMRIGASDAALQELRNMSSRDEGFSTKYSMVQASQTSTQLSPPPPSNSSRDSISATELATQAASLQQIILHGGTAVQDVKGVRGGSSFTSSTWQGAPSSNSSHSDLHQLVQATGSGSERGNKKAATVLERLFTSKGRDKSVRGELSGGEMQASFTDTRVSRDSGNAHHSQQQNGHAGHVQQSGPSWDSGAQLGGHCPSRSSTGSGVNHMFSAELPTSITGSMLRQHSDDTRSVSGKFWSAGASIMKRFGAFSKTGLAYTRGGAFGGDHQPMQLLKLAIRIGVATGPLPYGTDINNCAVKDRAKEYISDVANAGQILIDESTFLHIKDALSVLGTLHEGGYDDRMLSSLMRAQLVNKLQHQVACGRCIRIARDLSFDSDLAAQDAQDYEADAIVVHMGCFEVPMLPEAEGSANKLPAAQQGKIELVIDGGRTRSVSGVEALSKDRATADRAAAGGQLRKVQLQLYSVAAPGMRKQPETTQELAHYRGWCESVNVKPGWLQVQKGYFDAPAARLMLLTPKSGSASQGQGPLPDVTIVFASVVGASSYALKRSRSDTKYLNKVIRRCMLRQLMAVPGGDGYLCRCQEADLKYMIAFEHPHRAVQWCLAVQEALMYVNWPAHVLAHPGFEEVLDDTTGLPLFRGPRLRMGLAEGQPNSVLPDHTGRANYYGGCVNRAARYTDAAAHGGQVVTDVQLVRKLCRIWASRTADEAESAAESIVEDFASATSNAAATDRCQLPLNMSVPAPMTPQQSVTEPQERTGSQQQGVSGSSLGRQQLPTVWGSSCSLRGDTPVMRSALRDADNGILVNLEPVARSRSETMQHMVKKSADHHVTFSFSFGTRSAQQQQLLRGLGRLAGGEGNSLGPLLPTNTTALADLPEVSISNGGLAGPSAPLKHEVVYVSHLGAFAFKGSGQHDMALILHSHLARRSFPRDPPKGKGERLAELSGPVDGLDKVSFTPPAALLLERQAFKTLERTSPPGRRSPK